MPFFTHWQPSARPTTDTVEAYLRLREGELGSFAATQDSLKELSKAMGYHLVTVTDQHRDTLPVQCYCKSFQKIGQCSHSVLVRYLDDFRGAVDLVADFAALPAQKKRGRKPKALRYFGNCLSKA